jgi:hypothetical protein
MFSRFLAEFSLLILIIYALRGKASLGSTEQEYNVHLGLTDPDG